MPIWEGLSAWGQKVWGFLFSGVRRGLPGISILESLREVGLGYRTQVFYRDYNIAKEVWEYSQRMKFIKRDAFIPEERYYPAYSSTDYNFLTVFRVKVRDLTTMEERELHITVGHNNIMKRYELEDIARAVVEKSPYEFISAMPILGYRNMSKLGAW